MPYSIRIPRKLLNQINALVGMGICRDIAEFVRMALSNQVRVERLAERSKPRQPQRSLRNFIPEKKKNEPVRLLVLTGPTTGRQITFDKETIITRFSLCLWNTFISRVHARVFRRRSGVWVEDLHSHNGTFVNGRMIRKPHRLRNGDMLAVGGVTCLVTIPGEATSTGIRRKTAKCG